MLVPDAVRAFLLGLQPVSVLRIDWEHLVLSCRRGSAARGSVEERMLIQYALRSQADMNAILQSWWLAAAGGGSGLSYDQFERWYRLLSCALHQAPNALVSTTAAKWEWLLATTGADLMTEAAFCDWAFGVIAVWSYSQDPLQFGAEIFEAVRLPRRRHLHGRHHQRPQ